MLKQMKPQEKDLSTEGQVLTLSGERQPLAVHPLTEYNLEK